MVANKMNRIIWLVVLFSFMISCSDTGRKQNTRRKVDKYTVVSDRVVKILDGDTYDLMMPKNKTIRIRMDGIDAPEKGMPYGNKAKKYLGELCKGQNITVSTRNKDRYDRVISSSHLEDGRELGCEMLKAGLAWHYTKYNTEPELTALEHFARNNKIGLWVEYPYVLPPWIVRKLNKRGYKTQEIYKAQREHLKGQHVDGCPDVALCEVLKEENWYD